MTVPSSGAISLAKLRNEIDQDNYEHSIYGNTSSSTSLKELSDGTIDTINTNNASTDRPDGSAPHAMSEWYSYDHTAAPAVNTSFTVKSGFIHGTVTSGGGRRGTTTRHCFNEGYNGFTDSTNGLSDPPSGAITNGTNVGISSGILGDGTVLIMAHKSGGANGLHRVTFRISASSDSNSGFTQLAFANSTLSTSNSLQRTTANYTYASGYRQWQWAMAANTSWTYLTNGSSGHSSKIFGDASSGTGTDSGFSVTVTLT